MENLKLFDHAKKQFLCYPMKPLHEGGGMRGPA